jgi:hypothetical protein
VGGALAMITAVIDESAGGATDRSGLLRSLQLFEKNAEVIGCGENYILQFVLKVW